MRTRFWEGAEYAQILCAYPELTGTHTKHQDVLIRKKSIDKLRSQKMIGCAQSFNPRALLTKSD
jgi:hypothetical protein